eukprot:Gb_12162 [translate_table: standard]
MTNKDSKQTHAEESGGSRSISRSHGSVGIFELLLRLLAVGATLAAAIVMGTNTQTISLLTLQLRAKYSYSAALKFFVVANAIACAYSFLSLPITALKVLKKHSPIGTKFVLFLFDLVMVALVMAGASAATAIAYVGHKGNSHTRWAPICDTFDRFCDHVGGALVSSFIAVVIFMILTILSAFSLYKQSR